MNANQNMPLILTLIISTEQTAIFSITQNRTNGAFGLLTVISESVMSMKLAWIHCLQTKQGQGLHIFAKQLPVPNRILCTSSGSKISRRGAAWVSDVGTFQ